MQPPQKFAARHSSPDCVQLLWNHPDSEVPKIQRENLLYFLACHSQSSNFQKSTKGENITLTDLQPDTEYTCRVALTPSFPENLTATIVFTTLGMNVLAMVYYITLIIILSHAEPLSIQYVNNTPNIEGNTVKLEFQTNRAASKITCRISGLTSKKDCKLIVFSIHLLIFLHFVGSSHKISFENIPAGIHNVRIIAENNAKDRLAFKSKIHVSGTDPSSCAANMINNGITIIGNSVLVFFSGTNSADKFSCSLNKQAPFDCESSNSLPEEC